jgi:hypothetical protein
MDYMALLEKDRQEKVCPIFDAQSTYQHIYLCFPRWSR